MIQYDADSIFTLHFYFNSIGHHEFDGSFNCHAAPFYFFSTILTIQMIKVWKQSAAIFSIRSISFPKWVFLSVIIVSVWWSSRQTDTSATSFPRLFSLGWRGDRVHLILCMICWLRKEKRRWAQTASLWKIQMLHLNVLVGKQTNKKSWKRSEKMLAAASLCSHAVQDSVAPYQKQSDENNPMRAKTYMTSFIGRYCWIN